MKEAGLKFGILYGALGIVLIMVAYFVQPSFLFGMTINVITGMVLCLPFMYLAGLQERQKYEGYLLFGDAIRPAFLCFLVGTAMMILFKFVLINIIDPNLIDLQIAEAKKTALYLTDAMNTPADEVAKLKEELEKNPPVSKLQDQFLYWLIGLIFPGIVWSLLIAMFTKKNPPVQRIIK